MKKIKEIDIYNSWGHLVRYSIQEQRGIQRHIRLLVEQRLTTWDDKMRLFDYDPGYPGAGSLFEYYYNKHYQIRHYKTPGHLADKIIEEIQKTEKRKRELYDDGKN